MNRRQWALPALLVGLAGLLSGVQAQEDALEELVQSSKQDFKELEQLDTEITQIEGEGFLDRVRLPRGEAAQKLSIVQDLPIDPDLYIVGPADVLLLYIWGEFDLSYNLSVDPEGHILIPTVGDFAVAGMSLTQVRSLVLEATKEKYSEVEATLSLSSMRFFAVYITGAVSHEGSVVVHPSTRVSDLIDQAGGFIDELRGDIGEQIAGGKTVTRVRRLESRPTARRSVLLTHADATIDTVDLTMYLSTGDIQHNPYLQMGDRIDVKFRLHTVNLHGPFFREGVVEYRSGDTIADLVKLMGGIREITPIKYVELWRWAEGSEDYEVITVADSRESDHELSFDDFDQTLLKPKDQVFVRTISEWQYDPLVSIFGSVKYEGRYRIREGETRLSELVEMAGGFTDRAALDLATATSSRLAEEIDPELERVETLMRIDELRPEEASYLHSKVAEKKGDIVVDFIRLFEEGDASQDILLNGGDEIYVPQKRGVVKVTGQFEKPGLISFQPGQPISFYTDLAGGYARRADRDEARLIRAKTGLRLRFDDNLIVGESDEIWVPLTRYRDWGQITRTTVDGIAQALTMLVIVSALKN